MTGAARLGARAHARGALWQAVRPDGRACAAALALGCAALSSCASRPAAPDHQRAVVSVGVAQPAPGTAPGTAVAQVARLLGSAALVTLARDGRAQPGIADGWRESADGLTWQFFLRPGLTFHDGTPLDAASVASLLTLELQEPGPAGLMPGLRDVRAVSAGARQLLEIRLARPSSLLLEALALVPITGGQTGTAQAGPFRTVSRRQGVMSLDAFSGFYRGPPTVNRVDVRPYSTTRTAWSAMMRGEIDVLYEVAPESAEFLEAGRNVGTFSFLRPYAYVIAFNLAHPVLGRSRVRRALALAVDRDVVIDRALGGRGVGAHGHVSPRHWAYPRETALPHDPVLSTQLLDDEQLTRGANQASPSQGPSRFRFTCLVPADYPLFERLALVVQRELLDIGVDMALEAVPLAVIQQRLGTGAFEACLIDLAAGQGLNWPYWFWHSPADGVSQAWIRSGYRAADAPLDQVRTARTDVEFRAAVDAFEAALIADPPALFLCWAETTRAVRRRFEVPFEQGRDVFSTLWQWKLAGEGASP